MDKYNYNNSKFGTHHIIAREIGRGKVILDVGCNKGYLGAITPGNIFYGVEMSRDDARHAIEKNKYKKVLTLDLNEYQKINLKKKFDVIVFADILEHLVEPEKVLRHFVNNLLKKGGTVIVSLPNVANIATRVGLLFGNFDYADSGILDSTHLHLYTPNSGKLLLKSARLKISKTLFSSNNFGFLIHSFPVLGPLLGFNLIFKCQKKS